MLHLLLNLIIGEHDGVALDVVGTVTLLDVLVLLLVRLALKLGHEMVSGLNIADGPRRLLGVTVGEDEDIRTVR